MKKKTKHISILAIIAFVALLVLGAVPINTVYAQRTVTSYGSTATLGSTGYDNANSITLDNSDNIYIVGQYQNTVDFDPGAGTDSHSSNGGSDVFLTKINADGSYGYTKTFGGTGSNDRAFGITIDSNNNVYYVGEFDSPSIDFDPGAGVDNQSRVGGSDIFLTKINADGSYGYTKTFGGTSGEWGTNVATDADDNVYVLGGFSSASVDFDPGAGVDTHSGGGFQDLSLTKINADGSYGYTKVINGDFNSIYATGLATDPSGNVFVSGYFDGTIDFDPGAGTDQHSASASQGGWDWGYDTFLTKINADGSYGYTKIFESTDNSDNGSQVATDSSGNVYITNQFAGTADFDPGAGTDEHTSVGSGDSFGDDAFLTKINADGSYGYTKTFGDTSYDEGYSITVDDNDHVYIIGAFSNTVDFDPGAGTDSIAAPDGYNVFITKINQDGSYGFTKTFGNDNLPDSTYRLAVASDETIYTAAGFYGTVDFGVDGDTDSKISSGSNDIYFLSINQTTYQNITGLAGGFTAQAIDIGNADTTTTGVLRGQTEAVRLATTTGTPLADIDVDFSSDRDWSTVAGASDLANTKAFVHDITGTAGAASTFTMYVPYSADINLLGICPGADSLDSTNESCNGVYYLSTDDDSVTTVSIGGNDYWAVTGITGTGIFGASSSNPNTQNNEQQDSQDQLADTGINSQLVFASALISITIGLRILTKRLI